MVYSNERKLTLSAWLKRHREADYNVPLKLQKLLRIVSQDNRAWQGVLRFSRNSGLENAESTVQA